MTQCADLRKNNPLYLPRPCTSLMVFRRHVFIYRCTQLSDRSIASSDIRATYRITLLRHRGAAAAVGYVWLTDFRDFGLHLELDVKGEFGAGGGDEGKEGGELGDEVTVSVPGCLRDGEVETFG